VRALSDQDWLLLYFLITVLLFNFKELALLTRNQFSVVSLLYWTGHRNPQT